MTVNLCFILSVQSLALYFWLTSYEAAVTIAFLSVCLSVCHVHGPHQSGSKCVWYSNHCSLLWSKFTFMGSGVYRVEGMDV